MYGVIPNQNVGIRAFIPICEANNAQVHPSIHIVPGGHVFKENKLKIAKHCGNLPLRFQGNITDLSKKYLGGMVSCNADTYPSYSHTLTKKRKAHEANLHLHDDSSAPQIQCRYAAPSPVGLSQGTGARIALRNSTMPAKQVHHVPDCTAGLVVPGSGGSIPTFTNYANQTAAAASKTCPKPATAQGDYAIVVGEMLRSSNESYEVLAFLGRGTFGQVVKCRCSSTKRCVAIKILKNLPSYLRQGNVEIQILQTLSQQDTESHNIVRAIECFQHKNHMCFVFELLEQNLYEYLKSNKFRPLSLLEIRPITQQVLTALSKLKSLGLIHADLKPENIMLVSSTTGIMRYRVKVIDFGSACHSSKAVQNTYLQSRYYRAPEILLGLPFNEAIDMWSLGCVIAELFLGWPLYPGSSEYDQMRYIVETQGPPPPDLLQNAGKCSTFFIRDPYHCDWRLKTQEEYTLETGQQAKEARKYFFTSLSQICEVPGVPSPSDPDRELDIEDRQQFASLLSLMLKMRPSERVVPDSALLHPFITMLHLQAYPFSKRFHESLTLMQVCHEATRRQHLLSARSNLQQFSSLPSLHEPSSTGLISSTAPSPDSSTTKALLGPEASISLPHTSICHPSGSAVAYYAAAAVAAALTKPASQSVVEERMFSDPNNLRHYRMPNLVTDTNQQSSVTLFNNTHSCSTATEPSPATVFLTHPKADVYQSTQDVHSGFLGNRVSVPYSLSLYDLVAASGNALSLLNAVAAPVSSNFVAASVSNHQRVSSHSSRGCLYQLRQPPINRTELDPRLPAEQAEEAALVLSSYIGQEQSQLHRCEPYISVNVAPTTVSSTSLETVDLRDRLNAFVQQQQQQQQQQQLYRNPAAAFVAVQQRQQQHQTQQHHILSNHQPQEPILFAPSAAELNPMHVTNPYQTGLLPRTRALVQCSVPTSQQRIQFHQAKQRQTAVNFQSIPATRVVATHLLSGSRLQPQAGIVKPIYTAAIPLMSNPAVYVQELPQNYATLLQQQPRHHGLRITPSYPRSTSPSSTLVRNNQLLMATDQALPINLVTSAELDSGRERPPVTPETSKWAPDLLSDYSTTQLRLTPERVNDSRPKSIPSLSGVECSHASACCQSCAVISSATTTRFETSESENHLATSVESCLSECVQPTTVQNSTANTTSTAASSNPEKPVGLNSSDCKSNIESNLSTVSSASSLRSEKKIPVGRVQPMIKQEDCSSSTCFLPSPTLNFMSGNFRSTAGTSIYNDGATQRRIPPHCITRNSYHSGQPMSPDRPSIVTAPSTSSTRSSLRKQSHLSFSPSDTESQTAHHLSAAHAAAAAYHNLMYFQLQQQQQQQQHQQHRNQVPAVNFPTMPAIHLRSSHHCAVPQPNPVQIPIVNDAWPTTASMPELDDSTAAAASYYAAAAAAAAAAVAQREQQQQQHRQELELLLNQHAAQFHPHQLSAVAAAGDQHHHLSAQLFRQQ